MTTNPGIAGNGDHVEYRLNRSRELLGWLAGELACWSPTGGPPPEPDSPAGADPAGGDRAHSATIGVGAPALSTSAGVFRLTLQMSRLCELVTLTVDQVADHGDLGLAWVLLEQARQQLGHAANTAAEVDGDGQSDPERAEDVDGEPETMQHLLWLLQRDLVPWSEDASVVVEFGSGPDTLPDFRPDTPLEFGPLQLLAHASMTGVAGEAISDLDNSVMRMAFGEYVGRIVDEAMELLEVAADRSGSLLLGTLAETGREAGALLAGAFPRAEQIFRGPAGIPEAPED